MGNNSIAIQKQMQRLKLKTKKYTKYKLIKYKKRTKVALLYYRTLQSVKIESVKIKSAKKQVWLKMLKIA